MTTFKSRAARVAALVVRMALGAFFITSAVLKLLSIDEFEVYLFSYNVLSLRASMLAARLVIAAEALVGIGLMANIWKRFVDLSALLMLVGFTVFLCFSTLAGRSENCQCMGAMIEISPVQSILKNAVLLLLLVFAMGSRPWDWHPRWFLWLPAVLAPVAAVFVISAPDSWLFGPDEEVYNSEFLKCLLLLFRQGIIPCTAADDGAGEQEVVRAGDVLADFEHSQAVDRRDLPFTAVNNAGLNSIVCFCLVQRGCDSAHGIDGVQSNSGTHGADLEAGQIFGLYDFLIGDIVPETGNAVVGQEDEALVVQHLLPLGIELGFKQSIDLVIAVKHVRHHQNADFGDVCCKTCRVCCSDNAGACHCLLKNVIGGAHFGGNHCHCIEKAGFIQSCCKVFMCDGLRVALAVCSSNNNRGCCKCGSKA